MVTHNDHLIFAVGHRDDGTHVLVVGITAIGIAAMTGAEKLTLNLAVPEHMRNITDVVFFSEPTKADLRHRFAETGLPIDDYDGPSSRVN